MYASRNASPARILSQSTPSPEGWPDSVTSAEFELAVVGLGYVGLPLAIHAAAAGLRVVGIDHDEQRVASLNDRRSHVDDVSDHEVGHFLEDGGQVTAEWEYIRRSAAVAICVPTPLRADGGPDLAAVVAACERIGAFLTSGVLVVLESTSYPGTTDEIVRPLLEKASGLTAGTDFNLAFSPERVDPGNPEFGIGNTPKIVGGYTPSCTVAAASLYGRFVERIVEARGTREAETAKLLENTYRHVNIALVNEMARFCYELDIDIWDVIRLAETKPFGFQAFRPGPGVGGHCIPIDPNYLSFRVRSELGYEFRFVELAEEINASMPAYVVARAQALLAQDGTALEGARVLLLGVSYKKDIADDRESPAHEIVRILAQSGALVSFHDPGVSEIAGPGGTLHCVLNLAEELEHTDLAILLQAHSSYDFAQIAARPRRVLDTRGVLGPPAHRL